MATLTERELKSSIEAGDRSVYLIYGNDAGLKRLYCSKIEKKAAPEGDPFDCCRFEGDCNLQDVYDCVMRYPMTADRVFALLRDCDADKRSEQDFKKLLALAADTPDTAVLLILFDDLEPDDKKSARFKKLVSAVEKAGGGVAKLDHRRPDELVRTVCAAVQKRGCRMEPSTAKYLIEICSSDYSTIKNETEKLSAFAQSRLITREMVDAVCVRSVDASVYNISRELCSRRLGTALRTLDELFYLKVKPPVILSVLSSAFIEMYIARAAASAGVKTSAAAADFGYKNREFVLTRALDNARRLTERQIGLCLCELGDADCRLKSTSLDERVLIEELMVKLHHILSEGEKIDSDR